MNPARLKLRWGDALLGVFVFCVIALNFKPGIFVLGNDTYAPELNPSLSVSRYIQDPAWRSYRALGVPSDSEQADLFRSFIYVILEKIVPRWAISQIYVFFLFFVAVFGAAGLAKKSLWGHHGEDDEQVAGLVAGVVYATSTVSMWMLASPLYAFLTVFSILPFVLYRLVCVFEAPVRSNYLWLFAATTLFSGAAMVPTSYIVAAGVIGVFWLFLLEERTYHHGKKQTVSIVFMTLTILFATQVYWIVPFARYVKTNAPALTSSIINRGLTPNLIENEVKYSTFWQVPRFYFAWMDTVNDDGTLQYPFALELKKSPIASVISYMPLVLFIIGAVYAMRKGNRRIGFWVLTGLAGWMLLSGVNPPFGGMFSWMQQNIPLFTQVFRWQSSKVFPMLAIPLAVVGAYGVIWFGKIKKDGSIMLAGVVVAASCLFASHMFQGKLFVPSNLVSVPKEYFALSQYLKKEDPNGRIYIAPEANTLYFRGYSWGFFGSSLLNYFIPNPIIEKAMTTGSAESENAQLLISQAFNALDRDAFKRLLNRYNTSYVLYDASADRVHNGYSYDRNVAVRMLDTNPGVTKVWNQGSLALFRVASDSSGESSFAPVYTGHDVRRLNGILSGSDWEPKYISGTSLPGAVYPFALSFQDSTADEYGVTGTAQYQGSDGVYSFDAPEAADILKAQYDSSRETISLSVAAPEIRINTIPLQSSEPFQQVSVKPEARFVTFSDRPIALEQLANGAVVSIGSGDDRNMVQWGDSPQSVSVLGADGALEVSATTGVNAIAVWKGEIHSAQPEEVNICLFSEYRNRCVNQNHSVSVSGSVDAYISADEIVDPADIITAYVRPVRTQSSVSVSESSLTLYTQIASDAVDPASGSSHKQQIQLHRSDTISLTVPYVYSSSSYRFLSTFASAGPVSHDSSCGQDVSQRVIRPGNDGPIRFTSVACSDSVNISLPVMSVIPGFRVMVYWEGANQSGIPATMTITKEKSGYPYFSEYVPYSTSGRGIALFPLPEDANRYTVSLYSYGIGRRPSMSEISAFSFQLIPDAWYSMRLIPVPYAQLSRDSVLAIGQSFHPGWKGISRNAPDSGLVTPVRINGWEQGFYIPGGAFGATAEFTSNRIVYIGYGTTVVVGLLTLLWKRRHREERG